MKEYPHVPAAFINIIAEEGTKEEAIEWLQKTWNELCAVKAINANLMGDDEDKPRYTTKRLKQEITKAVTQLERELGEAKKKLTQCEMMHLPQATVEAILAQQRCMEAFQEVSKRLLNVEAELVESRKEIEHHKFNISELKASRTRQARRYQLVMGHIRSMYKRRKNDQRRN